MLDAKGSETGMFEVPAGGRRYQALALLVKQKRLAKTTPVPCVVREPSISILAEDDSPAENTQRVALHPLDQFRAFRSRISVFPVVSPNSVFRQTIPRTVLLPMISLNSSS